MMLCIKLVQLFIILFSATAGVVAGGQLGKQVYTGPHKYGIVTLMIVGLLVGLAIGITIVATM